MDVVSRFILPLLALAVLSGSAAQAGDAQQRFAVRGAGTSSCADFVAKADSNAPDLVAYVAWADGALSAANRYSQGVYDVAPFIDPPGILANLVLNLCRANPQTLYDQAVAQTIQLLRPLWITSAQNYAQVAVGEAVIRLYPETIKAVQAKLIAGGFLQGEPDGDFGDKSAQALAAFQSAKGRQPTGLPDAETVITLLMAP